MIRLFILSIVFFLSQQSVGISYVGESVTHPGTYEEIEAIQEMLLVEGHWWGEMWDLLRAVESGYTPGEHFYREHLYNNEQHSGEHHYDEHYDEHHFDEHYNGEHYNGDHYNDPSNNICECYPCGHSPCMPQH